MAAPHSPGATPEIHTLEEAAAILRVKKSWLERQAAARKIPFTMLGGTYHFTSGHLAEIVRIHEKTPTPGMAATEATTRRRPKRQQAGPLNTNPNPLRPRPRDDPRSAA
jgi:excisionase family DNA binding protein